MMYTNESWLKSSAFGVGIGVGVGVGVLFCVKYLLISRYGKCSNKTLLLGKTCIITGGSSGIGKAVATELAKRKANIILASRDVQKGSKAALEIRSCVRSHVNISVYELDLASFDSIKHFAFEINKSSIDVDILVNNAGLMACPFTKSADGYEMQFAVNHLGHFLLTNLLLPQMKNKEDARIVTVSSSLYKKAILDLINYNDKESYNPFQAYARSKLANIMFTLELCKRLPKGITINTMHPGIVQTHLGRYQIGDNSMLKFIYKLFAFFFLRSPKQGAETIVHMITDPDLKGTSGKYFGNCSVEDLKVGAKDVKVAEQLWNLSEKLTGCVY